MDNINIEYTVKSKSELKEADRQLIEEAEEAMAKAYAPYSNFTVGCAISLEGGKCVTGNNQENAAYPSGLCAERVALFSAKSHETTPIDTIAIVASHTNGKRADAFCCGNCRQVMIEYACQQAQPIRVLMKREDQKFIVIKDVKELLPFHFNSESLQ